MADLFDTIFNTQFIRYVAVVNVYVFLLLGGKLFVRDIAWVSKQAWWFGMVNGAGWFLVSLSIIINITLVPNPTPGVKVTALGLMALNVVFFVIWRKFDTKEARRDAGLDNPVRS